MKKLDRRSFFKAMGAAGLGSILEPAAKQSSADAIAVSGITPAQKIPTRPFGKTGVHVSILAFGGSHDLASKQLLMRQALKMGVTYWDTAHGYSQSEEAMGKYFDKFPEDRKKVFLVTKAPTSDAAALDQYLETSLQRLKTDYVDLFFIHKVSNVARELTSEVKAWSQRTKAKGKIRFFGFSTHKNMDRCLMAASKLGWIDGIMSSYNYRLMHMDETRRAVAACSAAGIGLTAMKTQAPFFSGLWADIGKEDDTATALTEQYMAKGFTVEQAKLKAVWENKQVASICSEMPNMTILKANAAAAMDRTAFSNKDMQMLNRLAGQTVSFYCTGCAHICESGFAWDVPISDIMRSLMYAQGYGDHDRARHTLRQIDKKVLEQITTMDFTAAEKACPRKLPIARLMNAVPELLA